MPTGRKVQVQKGTKKPNEGQRSNSKAPQTKKQREPHRVNTDQPQPTTDLRK